MFGSTRTKEAFNELSDAASDQFALILNSIADTVFEGAVALGLSGDEIQAAIDAFTIEEQRISLLGLSAEEQQAELQAVFSQIFDGLAGAVVPFIGQFQQVGEGLGETLIRVATEVLVVQEAIKQLGFQADQIDPEQFAQLSDGLIQAAGGLESFIASMGSFIDAFATDAHKFDVAETALTLIENFLVTVPVPRIFTSLRLRGTRPSCFRVAMSRTPAWQRFSRSPTFTPKYSTRNG